MGKTGKLALLAGVVATAGAAVAQPAGQKVTGPISVYWMSAQTSTGMGMPGMGGPGGPGGPGGGRPSMSAIMGMMSGGGGGAQHSLTLQLGSSRPAPGEPQADHLPPPGLQVGDDLPLVSPKPVAQPKPEPHEESPVPHDFQRPKGKMLIFWGCGEHVKPGQPVVLDFAQMSAGKMPPGMEILSRGFNFRPMIPPGPGRNTTYGDWPNQRTRTTPPSTASLVGEHTVRGNYTPDIKFSLSPSQDFMGPMNLTTNAKTPQGTVQLGWGPVSGAQAYLATMIGASQRDTVVMWTSSEQQAPAFAMPDYISPGDMQRLVGERVLMSAQTTTCTVPKEVVDAAPQGFLQMAAYGGEANFVFPPRPADPKIAWNRQWEVKVRYRSSTGGLLGMSMPGGGDERRGGRGFPGRGDQGQNQSDQGQNDPSQGDPKTTRRRAILQGIGGALGLPH